MTVSTDHTTFHSHDHRTDNLLKESRHDNSRHITIASLVIIIPQLRHDNNKQITFFTDHSAFHSHDHQTDTLLRESRHDNSRQMAICLTGHNNPIQTTLPCIHKSNLLFLQQQASYKQYRIILMYNPKIQLRGK